MVNAIEIPERPVEAVEEPRPTAKVMLPFRVVRGRCGVALEYEAAIGPDDHRMVLYRYEVGDPSVPGGATPLGGAILRLMEAYKELEGRVDGYAKERDEAIKGMREAEGKLESVENRIKVMEQRAKKRNE